MLAARDNGLSEKAARRGAETAAAYRTSIRGFATMPELAICYERVDASGLDSAVRELTRGAKAVPMKTQKAANQTVAQAVAKARSRDAWSAIAKITEVVDGHRRFLD